MSQSSVRAALRGPAFEEASTLAPVVVGVALAAAQNHRHPVQFTQETYMELGNIAHARLIREILIEKKPDVNLYKACNRTSAQFIQFLRGWLFLLDPFNVAVYGMVRESEPAHACPLVLPFIL